MNKARSHCGDQRFSRYVEYSKLSDYDRQRVRNWFNFRTAPWLPYEVYLYPMKKNGELGKARRYVPVDVAKELHDSYIAREVMES